MMPVTDARVESIELPEPESGAYGRQVVLSLTQSIDGGILALPPVTMSAMTAGGLLGAEPVAGERYRITVEPVGSDAEGA